MDTKTKKKKVAILIVSFNAREYLDECIGSLLQYASSRVEENIVVYDNHSNDGTPDYILNRWPQVTVIKSEVNYGYAGGNVRGWEIIQREGPVDYLILLNQDTLVTQGWVERLVDFMDAHAKAGSAQPLLMLYPETQKINSNGNIIQYLGFGYSSYNSHALTSIALREHRINYASGAATILRPEALHEVSLFEEFMFMYLEDLDLGWRLTLAGWENYLVPESVVYHKYEFHRGMRQFYFFERNRLWILLKNYRPLTLLLLLPVLLFMEAGILLRSAGSNAFFSKVRAYLFFLKLKNIRELIRMHKSVASIRRRSDRHMLDSFSPVIRFQPLASPILMFIVNPVLWGYYQVIRFFIFW